jgi:hypothetical protein
MIKINSSYKYPIFFFALIALISFCEISNSSATRADECATPITNAGGEWEWCSTQPATQILTFYKVAFCPALPTIPTDTRAIDITNCSTVFENTAGAPVSIVKGIGTTPNGTFSAPPYGKYTFAYLELSHVITYKANVVFTGTSANTKARSSTNVALGVGTGPNCHTNGDENNYFFGDIRGATCTGDVVGNAVNSNVIINSFDDGRAVYGAIVDEGVTIGTHIYLIQSNGTLASGSANNALAAGANKVAKLIFLLPMNVNVTPDTTGYNLKYNNTRGFDVLQSKNVDGVNFNVGLSASYFDMTLEVQ